MLHKILPILVLITATLFGAPIPTATGAQPGSQLIGEPFSSQLCFSNTGDATGYEPQFEMITPPGIKLTNAKFYTSPAIIHQETCTASECNVTNPLTGQQRTIHENESFYILDYPIGSFSTAWPEQCIDLTFKLDSSGPDVQLGNPLDIQTVALFALGATAVDDGTSIYSTPHIMTVDPTVYTLKKSNDAQEGERATGPSHPITATLEVDVADGEDIKALQVVDMLSGGMQFVALTSDGGCNVSAPSLPSTTTPGGTLTLECGDFTGALGVDRTITYNYYIPENDDNSNPVLGPNGQWQTLMNQAQATADYNGTSLVPADANSTVVAKAITMHKSSTIFSDSPPSGFGPGDTIEYTLTMDTSDYFAHNNITVTDTLGDGQHITNPLVNSPNSYSLSSGPTGNFSAANVQQCTNPDPIDGSCEIIFNLSKQLEDDGHSATVPAGTTITITFQSIIDEKYSVINGQGHIAMGDSVGNDVSVHPDIPGVGPGTPDSSHDSNQVDSEQLVKTVYKINGLDPGAAPYKIKPGETVTFRLKSVMPVKSFYDFNMTDYLPIPFLEASEVTAYDANAIPPAGRWGTGPDNTYDKAPVLSTDTAQNTITWTFGSDDENHQGTVLDILFTVTATNEPMADTLTLANIAGTKYSNAAGDTQGSAAIIDVVTEEPHISGEFIKTIIGSSNGNSGSITPPTDYNDAWNNVDANDTITYQLDIYNDGSATAYDVNLSDVYEQDGNIGQGLHDCILASATDAVRVPLQTVGGAFAGDINITQVDAGEHFIVQYTCVVDQDANPGADIDNTATLKSYASTLGGPNFIAKTIESKTKLQLTNKMEIVKNIVRTSIPDTSGNSLNQGEIVNFEINVTLGEGTYLNYILIDNTCTNLQLVGTSANVSASGTSGTVIVDGTGGSVDGTLTYSCETQAIASGTNTASVTAEHVGTKDASANWRVVDPTVITSKTMNPSRADAGDTITVEMAWTNDTAHPAYKCTVTDPLNSSVFDIGTIAMTKTPTDYSCSVTGNTVKCDYTGDLTKPCGNGPAEFTVKVRDDVNTSSNIVNEISFQGVTLPNGHPGENNSSINGSVESNATDTLELRSPAPPKKIFTKTSEGFTDPGDANLNGTPDVAIGEVIDVNITYGFYEGTTLNVDLDERFLDGGRLVYVPGTMTISRSNTNLFVEDTDVNSSLTAVPVGTQVSVNDSKLIMNNSLLRLSVGNVYNLNSSSGTSTADFTLHFRVKVQNESTVQAGVLIRDRGRVRFDDGSSGDKRRINGNILSARTFESLPTIVKDVNQSSVQAGTSLKYTIKVCNDETSTGNYVTSAFDWKVSDRLPDELRPDGGYSVDTGTTGATVNVIQTGQELNATIDRLDRGECISIDYNATIQPTAQFGQILTNTAQFTTTSLPGTYGSAGNLPGLASQEPGENNGERTGSGAVNDLFGSESETVTMQKGVMAKELMAEQTFYAIGEEAQYQIRIGLPKGETKSFKVTDTLPVGLEFNASKVDVRLGANVTATNTPPIISQSGQDVIFDFGDLNATALSGLSVDYNVTVENISGNQDGTPLQNSAKVTYSDPNSAGNIITITPATPANPVQVGEPNLFMAKRIVSGAVGAQAGSTVRWEVTVANNGHTSAYAANWYDTLPVHLAQIQNSILALNGTPAVLSGTSTALSSSNLIENNTVISLPLFDLPVGSSVTVTFDSIVQDSAIAGETQTNETNTSYSSILGSGARNGSDCKPGDNDNGDTPLNNYCESANQDLVIDAGIAVDKKLQGSNDNFTIGETLTYEIRVSLIEGITQNVVLRDTLPPGLRYVSHIHQNGAPQMIYDFASADANSGSGQDVVIDFGNVDNPADGNRSNDYIDVELTVQVENIIGNQDGHTPSNGDAAYSSSVTVTSSVNSAVITTPVPITVTEPDLLISKRATPQSQAVGDVVTYTIRTQHSGASSSDAWDTSFTDTLPAGMAYIPGTATGATVTQNAQVLTFEIPYLPQGTVKDITYQARIDVNADISIPLVNQLKAVYGSIDGANGDPDGGRNGIDGIGNELNNYALEASATVQPNQDELNPVKSVVWSEDRNNDGLINAGDSLGYNLSVTNTLAYAVGDVNVTDYLNENVTLMLSSIRVNGNLVANNSASDWSVSGYWYTFANSDVNISYNGDTNYFELYWKHELAARGGTLDVTFDVKINDGNITEVVFIDNSTLNVNKTHNVYVAAGTVIDNTFTVDSNRTVPTDSNEVNVTTDQRGIVIEPVKRLTATDQSFTDPGDVNIMNIPPVAVGEIIDVMLDFNFSGGTTKEVKLRDNFDLQNFVYVIGSATLERSSDHIEVSDIDLNSSFASNNPIVVDDNKIIHDANGFFLDVGDVFNDNYNAMNVTESLTLRFQLRVDNNVTVQAGVTLNDHGGVSFSEYHSDTNSSSTTELDSTDVGVIVVEPDVEITKTVDPSTAKVGEQVTYRLKVCNNESNDTSAHSTTGFDWKITDTLPDELDLVGDPQYNGSPMFNGRNLNISIVLIEPGHCENMEYNVTVNGAAEFEQIIVNTVRAESTSLRGLVQGERTGTGTLPNDLNSSSSAALNIDRPGVSKAIIAAKQYYPIGDTVRYNITLSFTGSARDLTIFEHFPSGLQYVPGSVKLSIPTDANVSHNPPLETNVGGNEMIFEIGDLNITTAGNLYLEFNTTVEDIVSNVNGTLLTNTIEMTFTDPNSGVTDSIPATAQPIQVGEPDLSIAKTITTDLSIPKSAGDTISYRIELVNSGTTTAYNVDWEDKVPVHTGEIHNPHQQVYAGTAYETNATTPLSDTSFMITTVDEPDDKIVLAPFDLSPGATLVITFDTIIQPNVIPAETLVNITGATTQSIASGGRQHTGIQGGKYAAVAEVSFSINQLPEAIDDCTPPLRVTHYGANEGDLGSNDILGDGTKAEHIWRVVTQPFYGSVVVNQDGTYIYSPDANYNGPDSFTYEIEDSNGDKDQAQVCIDVNCASTQTSDGGDAFNNVSMLLMLLFTGMIGLYFVRREENRGEI